MIEHSLSVKEAVFFLFIMEIILVDDRQSRKLLCLLQTFRLT